MPAHASSTSVKGEMSHFRSEMLTAAMRLKEMGCWKCSHDHVARLVVTMQDGGEPATVASFYLLGQTRGFPLATRVRAERLLFEYQQLIGQWFSEENHAMFSKSKHPMQSLASNGERP
jgi:hypothetical protein